MLTEQQPFAKLLNTDLAEITQDQTLIVRFAEEQSIATLNQLLKGKEQCIKAFESVCYVVGSDQDELNPKTLVMLNRIKKALNLTDKDIEIDTHVDAK